MATATLESFLERLHAINMIGLWELYPIYAQLPRHGRLESPPPMWRWRDVHPLLLESGDIAIDSRRDSTINARGGVERRNLVMMPQGAPVGAATVTMSCGVQYIKPGETAPAHRHDPAAIRFIIEGSGAYTSVEGEKLYMEPGDLILTPRWTWHEHGNDGHEPVIWMDGLDSPFVMNYLHADFWEPYPGGYLPVSHPVGYTRRRVGAGLVRPVGKIRERALPILYPWSEVYPELLHQKESGENLDAFDGINLEYVNPVTGAGPTLPTLSCRMQLLPAGFESQCHRHTSSFIYRVFRGRGWSEVGGHRVEWEAGDCFLVPSWIWHRHAASAGEDAILFAMSDQALLDPFDLYHEEAAPDSAS
jgi:gentisate 1,2-dioxygenase